MTAKQYRRWGWGLFLMGLMLIASSTLLFLNLASHPSNWVMILLGHLSFVGAYLFRLSRRPKRSDQTRKQSH